MSEIGAGTGTSYPSTLDTDTSLEVNSPNAGKTKARAEVINDLAAAVVAVQTELGTDPAGTKTDVKTFLQTEHAANGTHTAITASGQITSSVATGTAPLVIASTTSVANLTASAVNDGTNVIRIKIVNIGDWNMYQNGGGTGTKAVAHGLTASKIRLVSGVIVDDPATTYYSLTWNFLAGAIDPGLAITYDATNVTITRLAGTTLDTNAFDSTSYNRGWLVIIYVD